MKFCVQCNHHRQIAHPEDGAPFRLCAEPLSVDPVTGMASSCAKCRAPGAACGPKGKLHEPTLGSIVREFEYRRAHRG